MNVIESRADRSFLQSQLPGHTQLDAQTGPGVGENRQLLSPPFEAVDRVVK